METALSIGADHVIDYAQEDFTKSGQTYDLILAANGYHPIWDDKRVLSAQGTYVCTGGTLTQIFQSMLLGPLLSKPGGKQLGNLAHSPNQSALDFIGELLGAGKVVPAIDKRFPFYEVPEAMRYFGSGHARGKVVITMEHNG